MQHQKVENYVFFSPISYKFECIGSYNLGNIIYHQKANSVIFAMEHTVCQ